MALPRWQNPLDWLTQCWNIFCGRRLDSEQDAWLMGPIGKIGETPDLFIERFARERQLEIRENRPDMGLLDSMEAWGLAVNERVADFYTHTSDYEFEVTNEWKPVFGSLGFLVAKLFSRRIQQLNLPHAPPGRAVTLRSEIIQLVDPVGKATHTLWRRSIQGTGEVVFHGIYGLCRIPSGECCIKAVFPLPCGNATVIFRPSVDAAGNLTLHSTGRRHGDPGFYFLVEDRLDGWWRQYLPGMRETIRVFSNDDGELQAEHSLSLWALPVYRMEYRMVGKSGSADFVRNSASESESGAKNPL